MEVVSLVMEVLHEALEVAASYRLGQSALRYADKALWTVEKSARWAVPAPREREESGQQLIRPLPWLLFLTLLVVLRVAKESISLINLALGKPPLRSSDVVTYIQGKRRYLRTVKYQGGRALRARSAPSPAAPAPSSWRTGLRSLFSFTMCHRRPHRADNSVHSSGDELVVVSRRSVGGRSRSEESMERLLQKIDHLEADSDFSACDPVHDNITNVTNAKSEPDATESETNESVDEEAASPAQGGAPRGGRGQAEAALASAHRASNGSTGARKGC